MLKGVDITYLSVALFYVALWYIFSIGLTFFNKWLFKTHGLDTPLFVTFCHALTTCILAWLYRMYRAQARGETLHVMNLNQWLYHICPAGAATALDIGLSNMSLEFVDITLYTMVKSTVVVWLLISAFIFRIEKPSWPLVGVIFMISFGLILFRAKEGITFHSIGFVLVMSASILGGLRWVLTQLVLHKHKEDLGLRHPIDTMAYVTPCMALVLLPFFLYFEGHEVQQTPLLKWHLLFETICWVLFGAFLAFFLTFAEFSLVNHTSGLALSVAGIFKEICTIVVAVTVSGEPLTQLNVFGLGVSIAGIVYYNIIKYKYVVCRSALLPKLPNHGCWYSCSFHALDYFKLCNLRRMNVRWLFCTARVRI
eukprot:m.23770 g.23770  ORF g.23770 m.23770 type:complete len:367 (-) comp8528_c0_seq2:942-2042(-)